MMLNVIRRKGNANQNNFTPTSMAMMKKTVTIVGKVVKKLEPSYVTGGNVKWCSAWGRQFGSSSKCYTQLPYDPAVPLLRIYPWELKMYVHTEVIHKCSEQHYSSQKLPTVQISSDWCMNKQNLLYPYKEILLSYKKEWSSDTFAMWMNLENITLSESSQTQKATCYMIPFVWKAQNTQIQRDRKWMRGCQGLGEGGMGGDY